MRRESARRTWVERAQRIFGQPETDKRERVPVGASDLTRTNPRILQPLNRRYSVQDQPAGPGEHVTRPCESAQPYSSTNGMQPSHNDAPTPRTQSRDVHARNHAPSSRRTLSHASITDPSCACARSHAHSAHAYGYRKRPGTGADEETLRRHRRCITEHVRSTYSGVARCTLSRTGTRPRRRGSVAIAPRPSRHAQRERSVHTPPAYPVQTPPAAPDGITPTRVHVCAERRSEPRRRDGGAGRSARK
jgi:hypothetical protein